MIADGLLAILASVFSWTIFSLTLVIAAASIGMTWLLARRWTRHRRYHQLREAARSHGLKVIPRSRADFAPVGMPRQIGPMRIRWLLRGGGIVLARLQATTQTYNLLTLEIPANWPASALRPTSLASCFIDTLELFSYPSARGVERFTLHGVSPSAARRLSESQARGLLPPDVGLVLAGNELILDFSERPFDPIEFDRMIALARQLVGVLPVPPARPIPIAEPVAPAQDDATARAAPPAQTDATAHGDAPAHGDATAEGVRRGQG